MYRETTGEQKEELTTLMPVSRSFAKYVDDMHLRYPHKTKTQILEETAGMGIFIVEEDIPSGKAFIKEFVNMAAKLEPSLSKEKPKETRARILIYRQLAEKFFAVNAGVEWLRAFISGGGFQVVTDDPEDKIKKRNKDEIDRLNGFISQDYYTRGLDKITTIMLWDALVDGMSAAEIVYEEEMDFDDYATIKLERNKEQNSVEVKIEREDIDWEKHKSVARLKIIEDAIFRLTPHRHPTTYEVLFWVLDEEKEQIPSAWVKFLPEQIFLMAPNRRAMQLFGPSVVAPVANISVLLQGIFDAIGINFQRWGNKRYFFIMGTPERPWSPVHIRNFMKDTKRMVDKNKMGIPVPAGFDYKELGGELFEGADVINYFFSAIATGMLFPRDFMETGRSQASDKNWRAWLVRVTRMQRQVKRDIEQLLWEPHLYCMFGQTHRVPKKGVPQKLQETHSQYVPKLDWKAEGRWYIQEKIKMLTTILASSPNDPILPELKLAIFGDMAQTLGYGDIKIPDLEQYKKEWLALMQPAEEKQPKKPKKEEEETKKREKALEESYAQALGMLHTALKLKFDEQTKKGVKQKPLTEEDIKRIFDVSTKSYLEETRTMLEETYGRISALVAEPSTTKAHTPLTMKIEHGKVPKQEVEIKLKQEETKPQKVDVGVDVTLKQEEAPPQKVEVEVKTPDKPLEIITKGEPQKVDIGVELKVPEKPLKIVAESKPTKVDVDIKMKAPEEPIKIVTETKPIPPTKVEVDIKAPEEPIKVVSETKPVEVTIKQEKPLPQEVKIDVTQKESPPVKVEIETKTKPLEVKPIKIVTETKPLEVVTKTEPQKVDVTVKQEPSPPQKVEVVTKVEPIKVVSETKPVKVEVTTKAEPVKVEVETKPLEITTKTEPLKVEVETKPLEVVTKTEPIKVEVETKPLEVVTKTEPLKVEVESKPVKVEVETKPVKVDVTAKAEPIQVVAESTPVPVEVKVELKQPPEDEETKKLRKDVLKTVSKELEKIKKKQKRKRKKKPKVIIEEKKA